MKINVCIEKQPGCLGEFKAVHSEHKTCSNKLCQDIRKLRAVRRYNDKNKGLIKLKKKFKDPFVKYETKKTYGRRTCNGRQCGGRMFTKRTKTQILCPPCQAWVNTQGCI